MSALWDFASTVMDFSKFNFFFDGNIGSDVLSDRPALAAYDDGAGNVTVRWDDFSSAVPDSYNVYLDGVLNQNVQTLSATIAGLAAGSTHDFRVAAVVSAVEIASSSHLSVTVAPTSVSTVTLMKRPFPFPTTGMN